MKAAGLTSSSSVNKCLKGCLDYLIKLSHLYDFSKLNSIAPLGQCSFTSVNNLSSRESKDSSIIVI